MFSIQKNLRDKLKLEISAWKARFKTLDVDDTDAFEDQARHNNDNDDDMEEKEESKEDFEEDLEENP